LSSTYTHPLAMFGQAPGPTIGMWDNQRDWPLHASTVCAIEGTLKQALSEWGGQLAQVKLEQGALFDGERVISLAGRRTSGISCADPTFLLLFSLLFRSG
jgi:hypothetical protein